MKKLLAALFAFSSIASAAHLVDVKILDVKRGTENFELKLQSKNGPKDNYFFVNIVKSDPDAFAKMIQVAQKLRLKEQYKLDLDIISFSPEPNGSYYKSDGIIFRDPNSKKK